MEMKMEDGKRLLNIRKFGKNELVEIEDLNRSHSGGNSNVLPISPIRLRCYVS